jgi:hypothetical protein
MKLSVFVRPPAVDEAGILAERNYDPLADKAVAISLRPGKRRMQSFTIPAGAGQAQSARQDFRAVRAGILTVQSIRKKLAYVERTLRERQSEP